MIVADLHMKSIQNIYALHEKGGPHLALWCVNRIFCQPNSQLTG